jgi:hypothetical protein
VSWERVAKGKLSPPPYLAQAKISNYFASAWASEESWNAKIRVITGLA